MQGPLPLLTTEAVRAVISVLAKSCAARLIELKKIRAADSLKKILFMLVGFDY